MHARQQNSSLSDAVARLLCERSLEHTGDYYPGIRISEFLQEKEHDNN